MASRRRRTRRAPPAPPQNAPASSVDVVALVAIGGLVVALAVGVASWRTISRLEDRVEDRVRAVEARFAQVVDETSRRRADTEPPRRRGPDPDRVYDIRTEGAPVRGGADAPVTIVAFSDFQCPFCARVGPTLERVRDVYGDSVRIVWKHLPLDIHLRATGAHLAAVAAHRQGRFWEFHDRLFAPPRQLDDAAYRRYAEELGLEMGRFEQDRLDLASLRLIEADADEARSLEVSSTPAFFVNGRSLRGARPFEDFATMINAELDRLGLPVPDTFRMASARD